MKKKFTITKPYIEDYGDKVRLESVIKGSDFEKIFYFEVDNKYKNYLCYERSDAFLMGLLYFALVNGYDIRCEAPLSEKLYHQLSDIYIPTVVKNDPDLFMPITIISELDSMPVKNQKAVGASVSGGVDSFYTIVKNLYNPAQNFNITHLVLTNCFNIYYDDNDTRRRFESLCLKGEKISNELDLDFVKVYTNDHIFWYPHFIDLYCFRYMAIPYSLQKLFSVYNYSTGYQYKDFTFKAANRDASHYDFFTAHLISNENLTIYSHGGEASRAQKAEFIADNKVVQNNLFVCNVKNSNCCICEKCLRTQFNLYACNKLDKFSKVFDLKLFEKNKNNALVEIIGRSGDFDIEILEMMEKNHIKIPTTVIIRGRSKLALNNLKKNLKKFKPLYRLVRYFKSNKTTLDYLDKSEKFNMNHDFAKQCDSNII